MCLPHLSWRCVWIIIHHVSQKYVRYSHWIIRCNWKRIYQSSRQIHKACNSCHNVMCQLGKLLSLTCRPIMILSWTVVNVMQTSWPICPPPCMIVQSIYRMIQLRHQVCRPVIFLDIVVSPKHSADPGQMVPVLILCPKLCTCWTCQQINCASRSWSGACQHSMCHSTDNGPQD